MGQPLQSMTGVGFAAGPSEVGDVRIEVVVKGTHKAFTSRYLQVWRREGAAWRMASWQSTPVPA